MSSGCGRRLAGRHAIVTGGGRGIGRSIALGLAAEGADVTVTSRTGSELDEVVDAVVSRGSRGHRVVVDAMDGPAIKRSIEDAHSHFGRLDILVNNVGGVVVDDIAHLAMATHDDATFESNIFLNLTSAYYATRAGLPHMIDAGFGRIINIGSGYAKRGGGVLAYATAKHGIVGFTRTLAGQVPTSITVNCLCPGWTNTALVDWDFIGAANGVDAATARAAAEAECIQDRILEPDELAPMAVLLASSESFGITGQVISVDGGYKV